MFKSTTNKSNLQKNNHARQWPNDFVESDAYLFVKDPAGIVVK